MMRRTAASLAALLCLGCPAWAADPPRAPAPPPATRADPPPSAHTETTPAPMAHPVPPGAPPGSITVRLNGQMGVSGGVGLR